MTRVTGGGGGGGLPAGVSSDNDNGLVINGGLSAGNGDPNNTLYEIDFAGGINIADTAIGAAFGFNLLFINQGTALPAGSHVQEAVYVQRQGNITAADYAQPVMTVIDSTASTQGLAKFIKGSTPQFLVNSDGITVHNKFRTGAAVAHTLGAYSGNAVPIYNEAGTLLGYMPLYA